MRDRRDDQREWNRPQPTRAPAQDEPSGEYKSERPQGRVDDRLREQESLKGPGQGRGYGVERLAPVERERRTCEVDGREQHRFERRPAPQWLEGVDRVADEIF